MELTFASLMARAAEPDALYALAARAVRISEDGLTSLPIFSRAYYSKHAFDETTLEPSPVHSGPCTAPIFICRQKCRLTTERPESSLLTLFVTAHASYRGSAGRPLRVGSRR
jgi:hypothetical protein